MSASRIDETELEPVLLRAEGVTKHYPVAPTGFRRARDVVHAVDGVDLDVRVGETLGLVGESGCGKSTLGRCLIRLTDLTSGTVKIDDRNITALSPRALRRYRTSMQMVFQDPYSSLNPRKRIGESIGLSLRHNRSLSSAAVSARVRELLDLVGLRPDHASRFPHEFSGGQRQRIGIARALAAQPALIVADEPVSALDVSVQAQIINLFADLKQSQSLTYLFIAHDLSVVRQISDRIAVMYLGKIVELGAAELTVRQPLHPYTRALLTAVPIPVVEPGKRRERVVLRGDVPSPINPPAGCRFHPRCPLATDLCRVEEPLLAPRGRLGRVVACHYPLADE